jgi:hypothetical protein
MSPQYILHKNPVQMDTLAVVQYLHCAGRPCTPFGCVERGHPEWATELPCIETVDERCVGLDACVRFWERVSGVAGLMEKALAFKEACPEYRIAQARGGVPS